MSTPQHDLPGITVLERGWLSSNNVLLHGRQGQAATLIDSAHSVHAPQTVALLRHALAGQALARVINTHLHSDHCGGNATLQAEFGAEIVVPSASLEAVAVWDEARLSYRATGQRCHRFSAEAAVSPGEVLNIGERRWEVLAAPGHDPDSVMLFDADDGVLVSADALWENGFGVIFPELEGVAAFEQAGDVLALIARLPVRCVIPGHGAPFTDVPGALVRARSRLQAQQRDPARHARHAAKVLVKYHLMEEGSQGLAALRRWADATPLFHEVWRRFGQSEATGTVAWCDALVRELAGSGALRLHEDRVVNL
jgi:glyoxylase-like metal-dependent hydrolase (beta-lactamase superfamily II)